MGIVYPICNVVVGWSGGKNTLRKDQPWDDSADLVKERPDLFDTEPTVVYGRRTVRVEAARSAPGEVRDIDYPCPDADCDWRGSSERAVKTHVSKAHR